MQKNDEEIRKIIDGVCKQAYKCEHLEILTEFVEAGKRRGYIRPKNLSELERCPVDDEQEYQEDSTCPVDHFLKKNKGLR